MLRTGKPDPLVPATRTTAARNVIAIDREIGGTLSQTQYDAAWSAARALGAILRRSTRGSPS